LPCEAGLPGEDLEAVQLLNLSVGGMKFQCGLQQINRLLPEQQRIPGMVMDVILELRLKLEAAAAPAAAISARARLVHYERLAQDCFHVGVEFTDIDKTEHRKLEDFVNDHLQAAKTALSDTTEG
jgi:c-di-GMP-binding flagellar brake protein YcgR